MSERLVTVVTGQMLKSKILSLEELEALSEPALLEYLDLATEMTEVIARVVTLNKRTTRDEVVSDAKLLLACETEVSGKTLGEQLEALGLTEEKLTNLLILGVVWEVEWRT